MVWFCLEISSGKEAKMPFCTIPKLSAQVNGASPMQRSACLAEPKAPKLQVLTYPRQRLLCFAIGPHLGEGPLCLGEPEVIFFSHFFR